MKLKNTQKGFSLIELMIVVLIVGILGAVSYPSYVDYVRNSKLPEATTKLAEIKNKMEQYFQDERTYTGACSRSNIAGMLASTENFSFNCNANGEEYTLSAKGISEQVQDFEYVINEIGQKQTISAPSGYSTGACWVMSKSGCL